MREEVCRTFHVTTTQHCVVTHEFLQHIQNFYLCKYNSSFVHFFTLISFVATASLNFAIRLYSRETLSSIWHLFSCWSGFIYDSLSLNMALAYQYLVHQCKVCYYWVHPYKYTVTKWIVEVTVKPSNSLKSLPLLSCTNSPEQFSIWTTTTTANPIMCAIKRRHCIVLNLSSASEEWIYINKEAIVRGAIFLFGSCPMGHLIIWDCWPWFYRYTCTVWS